MAQIFYANVMKSSRNVQTELEKSTGRLYINEIDAQRDCEENRETIGFVALSLEEYQKLTSNK